MFVSHELMQDLSRAAQFDVPVLISAPSLDDCEQLATLIHRASTRAARRFSSVSCGSLTPASLEASLLGTHGVPNRGTLLLAGVDALSADAQLRLLAFLESRNTGQVRLIAATTRDLFKAVRCGRFQPELFYRLNVIHLMLPASQAMFRSFESLRS